MPIVSLAEWNQYLQNYRDAHLLQAGEWGELKSAFGWKPVRVLSREVGAQILFRKLPLGFTIGYIPKLAISDQRSAISQELWREIDAVCRQNRAIFLKLEPDLWHDPKPETLRHALSGSQGGAWHVKLETSPHNIQPLEPSSLT